MENLVAPVLSLGVAIGAIAYLADPRARVRWMDHPNERSLHERAVPRTGGVGILAGVTVGWLAAGILMPMPAWTLWIAGAAALVAIASSLDDMRGLGVAPRLLAHLLAAVVLLRGLAPDVLVLPGWSWPPPAWAATGLGILFVIWMANLYNFMDGMDGLAGGMTAFGFAFLALLGWRAGVDSYAVANLCIASAAIGFLLFNFPPARIFMGDTGATTLGLLAAASILWGQAEGVLPLWAGILIFSPFIVDATATLLRRVFRGERFWTPHRKHAYQRLARSGWGHRRTLLAEYLLMAGAGFSALLLVHANVQVQATGLLIWTGVYVIILAWVERHARRWVDEVP